MHHSSNPGRQNSLSTMLLLALLLPVVLGAPYKHGSTPNLELGNLLFGDIMVQDGVSETEMTPMSSVVDRSRLWEQNTVYYIIDDPTYTPDQIAKIENGIQTLISSVQGCVNIVPRQNEANYVRILDKGGCSSYVGRVRGPQDMSLADGCIDVIGTIMHEFLHALGIYHEQSRGDRNTYVTINFDNIEEDAKDNFEMLEEGVTIDHLGTPYDYGSVMHYPGDAFDIDDNILTIITTDPSAQNVIGQRTRMSDIDVERIQVLYGCVAAENTKYFKHLAGKNVYKN